jgi:photosystem II stability/assembly factor-like uncharacterized protein
MAGVWGKRWALLVPFLFVAAACGVTHDRETHARGSAPAPVAYVEPPPSEVSHPTGLSFIDESAGWVIGEAPCPDGQHPVGDSAWLPRHCLRIIRTRDGGRHWEATATPATGGRSRSGGSGGYVTDIRFADARNGWVFDWDLWSTHDGGATWTAPRLDGPVVSLETTGGKVFALVASCRLSRSDCRGPLRLFESAVGSDDWRLVFDMDAGSGVGRYGRLVVSGRSVYALVDRSGTSWATARPAGLYARSPGGRWERRLVPPSCFRGVLAAAGPRELFLWCQTGDGAGGSAPHEFYVSRRDGFRWAQMWSDRSVYFNPVAVTSEGRFLATSVEVLLIERPDGSRDWIRFDASGQINESIIALQFLTARYGVVLTGKGLYITRDAGRYWDPVPLPL